MKIEIVQPSARMKRGTRNPKFDMGLSLRPYGITPMMIHPVLPGETLKKLWWQLRGYSSPLKHRLMGAHFETFFFYVKHTDLDDAATLINMHVTNASTAALVTAGNDAPFFHAAGGINYMKKCYDLIVKWYFRDGDEALTPASGLLSAYQPARVDRDGWWESAKKELVNPTVDHELPGEATTIPDGIPTGYATMYDQWERMRALSYTTATFEDYLRSNGVGVPEEQDEELKRPELLRHTKEWVFPANTVEPTTGTPSSAHVVSITDSADKDRYFREPGFIVGVAVYKPKVYLGNITGSLTHFMTESDDWLPAILQDQAFTSLKEFATGTGPAPVAFADDYWVDLRDLLLYGEQFRNTTTAADATNFNSVAIPDTALNKRYLTVQQSLDFFTDSVNGRFYIEGVCTAAIASPISKDHT